MVAQVPPKQASREVDVIDIGGQLRLIRIFDTDKQKTPIGYALVTMEKDLCVIWHISIQKEFRRQKFASHIILAIKNDFKRIETMFESEEVKEMFVKNGFELKLMPHSSDRAIPVLVWIKEGVEHGKT
jgi:ribosomal protein S18 acetylase RimI-like enzyme